MTQIHFAGVNTTKLETIHGQRVVVTVLAPGTAAGSEAPNVCHPNPASWNYYARGGSQSSGNGWVRPLSTSGGES